MALILILGASRGLGRALTEAYAQQGHRVIATVRKAEDMAGVQALGAEVLQMDLADPASVSGLAWRFPARCRCWRRPMPMPGYTVSARPL